MKKSFVKVLALALVAVMLVSSLVSCGKKLSGSYEAEIDFLGQKWNVTYTFSGSDVEGYAFCMVTRKGDLRALGKEMTKALSGRGGGKPICQQGRVSASRGEIEAFFAGQV